MTFIEIDENALLAGQRLNEMTDGQLEEILAIYPKEDIEKAMAADLAVVHLIFDFNVPKTLLTILTALIKENKIDSIKKNDYETVKALKMLYDGMIQNHGRLPRIFPYLIEMIHELNVEEVIRKFDVKGMKYALSLEEEIPSIHHRISYGLMFHKRVKDVILQLKKHQRNLGSFISGIPSRYPLTDNHLEQWVISYAGKTRNETIHEVMTFWNEPDFPQQAKLERQKQYFANNRKEMEWERCKKKYPNVFSSEFQCSIFSFQVEIENEKVYIMDPNDKRQVILGQLTVCCQRLNGSAEASMMEGLVNPDSGFLVFEREDKVLGQAWIWLSEDKETLVLDNIELADNRKPHDILLLLKHWVIHLPYGQVQMGVGFNQVKIGKEVAIEDFVWFKRHWNSIYTDAHKRVWLKKDHQICF